MANWTKNDELNKVFSERMWGLIEKARSSNAEIERAMDIPQATFQNVMQGKTTPSVDFVVKCADFLGVSVDYLLGRCDTEGRQGDYDFEEIRLESYERYLRHKRTEFSLRSAIADGYESPWPYNLAEEIIDDEFPCIMTWDQKEGLREASTHLTEREQEYIWLYYKLGYTLAEIGDKYSLGAERIRQVIAKGIRKMKHPRLADMVRYGYSTVLARGENDRLERENKELEERIAALKERIKENSETVDTLTEELAVDVGAEIVDLPSLDILIDELDLSVRAYNCLHRAGCRTVGDIVKLCREDPYALNKVRNLGKHTKAEIEERLLSFGVDITKREEESGKELA